MSDLSGKRGVILGVGNQRSIAWAIAQHFSEQGAELALTYLTEPKGRFEANVRKLGDQVNATLIQECDVAKDDSIQELVTALDEHWGELDFLVHSLAFADQKDLQVPFSSTSREGFAKAHDISAFSLLPLAEGIAPMMKKRGGGSIISMSFIGSMIAVPHYHVMGPAKAALESSSRYLARELGPDNIRVNVVSPGAIRTLSSSGIKDFSELMRVAAEHSALKRTATQQEVAQTSAFLVGDGSSAITGQVIYVDCGYSIMAN